MCSMLDSMYVTMSISTGLHPNLDLWNANKLHYITLLLASMQTALCLTNACCCMYSLELLMMDGKTVRNM